MGAQSSKHAAVLESVASNDPRRLKTIFADEDVSPLLLIYVLSREDEDAVFPHPPRTFEKRPKWKGQSPLHYAAEHKDTRVLKQIAALLKDSSDRRLELSTGKAVQYTDIWGQRDEAGLSPLSRAVKTENIPSIEVLAEAGANLDEAFSTLKQDGANSAFWSHVRYAAAKGLRRVLVSLLDAGADFNEWGLDGRRPVHLAVEAGQLESLKELLKRDMADIEEGGEHDNSDEAKRLRTIAKYLVRETNLTYSGEPGVQITPAIERSSLTGGTTTADGRETRNAIRSAFQDAVRGIVTVTQTTLRNNRERGGNLLHVACVHSHAHIVEYLVSLKEFEKSFEEMNDSGKTPVFMAIRHSSLDCLKLLVDAGADVQRKDIENWTALHEAVKAGDEHIDVVEYLISEFNMDVNAADDDGWTPLHVAARFSATKAVDVLVRTGSNIDATTEDKETAVLLASGQATSAEIFRKLLAHGADLGIHRDNGLTPSRLILRRRDFRQLCILLDHLKTIEESSRGQIMDLESQSETGDTLLHVCVEQKSAQSTQKLLEIGAGPDEKNHEGIAPLHIACKNGEGEIARILLQGGANANILRADGMAPAHIACDSGHDAVVAALIEAKCDLNIQVEQIVRYKGFSPLMFASRLGNAQITSMLIKGGADLNLAKADGFTALHLAALNGSSAVCRLLLEAGADYRVQDEGGYLPLQLATRQGQLDVVSAMLEANVDPDCCGERGLTSLHVAAYICDARLIWVLLRGGANVNAVNRDRVTPLHVAAGRDQGRVTMQLLLANGAQTEVRDREEDTPLHNACYRGLYQNARLLLRRGAEPSPVNENGATPLHLAAAFGSEQTVEALLRHGADVEARDYNRMTAYRVASAQQHRQAMVLLFRAMKMTLAEIAPKRTFARSPSASDEVLCVICQSSLSSGEATRTLLCGHCFHDGCILAWLGGEQLLRHDSCPLCQRSVLPEETPQSSAAGLST